MGFRRLFKSFKFASKGVVIGLKEEQNIKIAFGFTFINLILGWLSRLSPLEWAIIILTTGLCLVAEIINTALEVLLDMISPEYNGRTKIVKDIAAGAALLSAACALIIALIIYLPHWF